MPSSRPPRTVHIVVHTTHVGGAEKRFAGLFLHLSAIGYPVKFVIPEVLFDHLAAIDELAKLATLRDRVMMLETSDIAGVRRMTNEIVKRAPDSILHYVLVSPLRAKGMHRARTVFTIAHASLRLASKRGLVELYGGVLRSDRIDVLDPSVLRELRTVFPWRARTITQTPGSFVDLAYYAPARPKKNDVVFLGLFSNEKQAPRLAQALPEIHDRLTKKGFSDVRYFMLGRDSGPESVTELCAKMRDRVPVEARFESNPRDVLSRAKVFLSLQRNTNHPSKSLLEAMACGALPVVTDTRDSRRSAPDRVAQYVPREFSAADIADACAAWLGLDEAAFDRKVDDARAHLAANFSIEAMGRYFEETYASLG